MSRIFLQNVRKYSSQDQTLYEIFRHYFGLQQTSSSPYIEKNNLYKREPDSVKRNIEYCLQVGYSPRSILENPILLRANAASLKQQYNVLTEGGFINITPTVLSKFKTLSKRKVEKLKSSGLIASKTNVARNFIKYLDVFPSNFSIEKENNEEWIKIHNMVLTEYLITRLKVPEPRITRLLKYYPDLKRKSFRFLCENIAMAEELSFDSDGILRYGDLLTHDPDCTKETLRLYPDLAGADMRKAMKMFPKLTATSTRNFTNVYKVLKDHGIPDEMIRNKMNVFQLSPNTVDFRLQELKRANDLKVLLSNPHILQLVVHHNRAKSRLHFMKELRLKCTGVRILGNDNESNFDSHIKEGRDINKYPDVYKFLRGLFGREPRDFQERLRKHPFFLQVPLVLMDDTFNYLRKLDFSSDSIFKVICIMLYSKDKIEKSLEKVETFKDEENRDLSEVETLNLILYFMEKEHHFTGNGIWNNPEDDVTDEIAKMNN